MICIRCQRDSKYPERKDNNGRCPGCNEKFAFEPRDGDKLTDKAFQRAIEQVSSEGQLKWGVEHLYYEICRKRQSRAGLIAAGIFFPIILLAVLFVFFPLVLIVGPLLLWLFIRIYRSTDFVPFPRGDFEKMWDRWGQIHGKPKGVIIRKPQEAKPPRAPEPDLGDYSFDRAVICDRARTVDLLLANNFHFENNCAVLSMDGYPKQAFDTVRRMLRRNPRLEVFVLHDITPEGCQLAWRLANDPEWFKGTGVRIVDVGLRPVHARPFGGLLLKSSQSVKVGQGISREEAQWLSRSKLELAVIRPEQVLKRLFRAMNQATLTRAPQASLARTGTRGRLGQAAAAGAAGAVGAAALTPGLSAAELEQQQQLAKKQAQQQQAAQSSGGDGGGDYGSGFELDLSSFSSDADSSDGGADSFG
jgi:hypothetical protein